MARQSFLEPLVACQYSAWYPAHAAHALKSVVIPLPQGFLNYLQEDGVFLPEDSAAIPRLEQLGATILAEDDYRRDGWGGEPPAQVAAGAGAASAPEPSGGATAAQIGASPSGPLATGAGNSGSSSMGASTAPGAPAVGDSAATHGGSGAAPSNGGSSDGDSDDDGDHSSGAAQVDWAERFPALQAAIDSAITDLGGCVVPKLNWSCPSDAVWISSSNSLACANADEVVLLLKSSDRVAHDAEVLAAAASAAGAGLSAAADASAAPAAGSDIRLPGTAACSEAGGTASGAGAHTDPSEGRSASNGGGGDGGGGRDEATAPRRGHTRSRSRSRDAPQCVDPSAGLRRLQPVLVLRAWHDLRPEREFRCFVRSGELVAVCQRDISQHFPQLAAAAVVVEMQRLLWAFWLQRIKGRFQVPNYAYDVYVATTGKVKLLDFNPPLDSTSPLLFTWEELGYRPSQILSAVDAVRLAACRTTRRKRAPGAGSDAGSGDSCGDSSSAESDNGGDDDGNDAMWLEDAGAAGGLGCIELPSCAAELLLRTVERDAGHDEGVWVGGGAEAGLGLGPMQLGARAACAMPYDMLGLSQSVDKMVEVMQRHKQQQQQQQPGQGPTAAAPHACDPSRSAQPTGQAGARRQQAAAAAAAADVASAAHEASAAQEVVAEATFAALVGGAAGAAEESDELQSMLNLLGDGQHGL